MAHQSLRPQDDEPYHEGDAFHIHAVIKDPISDERIDISESEAEFRVKEDPTDDDADALLEKTGEHLENEDQIQWVNPTEGRIRVTIDTGDTDGFLTENEGGPDEERLEFKEFYFHLRIIDDQGNQVTTADGWWEMEAS